MFTPNRTAHTIDHNAVAAIAIAATDIWQTHIPSKTWNRSSELTSEPKKHINNSRKIRDAADRMAISVFLLLRQPTLDNNVRENRGRKKSHICRTKKECLTRINNCIYAITDSSLDFSIQICSHMSSPVFCQWQFHAKFDLFCQFFPHIRVDHRNIST